MNEILDDRFFNFSIDESIEKKLITEANCIQPSHINFNTAEDIQSIICHGFIDGVGFTEYSSKLLALSYKILTQYTDYPWDIISPSICSYLFEHMPSILSTVWYQNCHSSQYWLTSQKDPKNNIVTTGYIFQKKYPIEIILEKRLSLKECEYQVEKYLDGFLCMAVSDTFAETKEIESDFKYSLADKINAIKNTHAKLLKINNSYINDDELEQLLSLFPTEGQQVKTFLKLITRAKCNYLCCDEEFGLVYIDIINIVYGVYNIKRKLIKYDEIIKPFQFISKSSINEFNIKIQNLHNNLISFKKKININQITQYVSIYHYSYLLHDDNLPEFNDFKKFIAKTFNRTPSKLFQNELDITSINKPFNFSYYHRWEHVLDYEMETMIDGKIKTIPIKHRLDYCNKLPVN